MTKREKSMRAKRRRLAIANGLSSMMVLVCFISMGMFKLHDWGLPMWLAIGIFFLSLFGIAFFIGLSYDISDLIEKHDKEMKEMMEYEERMRRIHRLRKIYNV